MKGIPTMYHGRRYRSRLEVRWAVMFDFFSWRYEYEPYDLEGWIPDFALFGASEIIVEVKPTISLKEFGTAKILAAMRGTEKWGKEILLLGSTIRKRDSGVSFGLLGEFGRDPEPGSYSFSRAILNYYEEKWGFYHEEGGWNDRMTGLYDGAHYLHNPDYGEVVELWNEAGNIVQWKGVR